MFLPSQIMLILHFHFLCPFYHLYYFLYILILHIFYTTQDICTPIFIVKIYSYFLFTYTVQWFPPSFFFSFLYFFLLFLFWHWAFLKVVWSASKETIYQTHQSFSRGICLMQAEARWPWRKSENLNFILGSPLADKSILEKSFSTCL